MALTKVSTDGVKDDAITSGKIPANAVGASELADNAVDTNAIANNAVTAGKTSGVQTTINNNADNRVITGSGTANTLEGEANLTFDGDELQIHHATDPEIHLNINTHGDVGQIKGDADGLHLTGNGSSNQIRLKTNNTERLRIQSNGDVYLNPTQGSTGVNSGAIRRFNAGLDFWTGTAGSANAIKYAAHGLSDDNMYGMGISTGLLELQSQQDIGFFCGSAGNGTGRRVERARITLNGLTFNGDTAADNAINDYEEGSWTPSLNSGSGSLSVYSAKYTKIGRQVAIQFYIQFNGTGGNTNQCILNGLPFTVQNSGWTASHLATAYSRTNIHCRAMQGSTQIDIKGDTDGTVTYAQLNGSWALSSFVYFTDS